MSHYVAERHAGSWRVIGADGRPVSEHGAGARGAAAASAAAERLNKPSRTAPTSGPDTIRAWRKAHALTQAQLARLLGVQWLAVQRWEAGTRTAPPYLPLALQQLERQLEDRPLS